MVHLLSSISKNGAGEIVTFIIVIAIVFLPWFKLITQDRHLNRAEQMAHENRLLDVISDNSLAISSLRQSIADSTKANTEMLAKVASSYAMVVTSVELIGHKTEQVLAVVEECLELHHKLETKNDIH